MRMFTVFRTVAILLLMVLVPGLSATAGNGVKLLNENFDYTAASNLILNGNWKEFKYFTSGSGNDPVKVIAGGLTFPGYQATAVGNSVALATKGNDASISFVPQNGVIYASMLVNVKAAPTEKGDFFFSFGDLTNSNSEGYGKLHVKNVGGKLAFSVTRRDMPEMTSTTFTDAVYNFNQTYLIVVKFTQDATDGKAELFINSNPNSAEPTTPLISSKGGSNPKQLRYVNLYQGRDLGNDVTVDAIRVATSWEALFDASEVAKLPYITVPATFSLGMYTEGSDKATVKKVNIKAENLTEDVTVSYTSEGYFTLKTNKITKEECMGEKGYDLEFTLKPKDKNVTSDKITFTSGSTTNTMNVSWNYIIPTPRLDAQDIATVVAARKLVYYTLVNPVTIKNVEVSQFAVKYTIEDASGSMSFMDEFVLSRMPFKAGTKLTNLVIDVQSEPETPSFTPIYFSTDSPELITEAMKQNGVKTFNESFEYAEGNLAGNGDWTAYKYSDLAGDPMKMEQSEMDYMFYQNFPVGNAVVLSVAGEDATAKFQGVGGAVYSSFLANVRDASEEGNFIYSFGQQTQDTWGGYGFVFVKKVGDKLAFGISQNGTDNESVKYSQAIYNMNENYLLALKYYQGPGNGDDCASLFINPNVLGHEPKDTLRSTETRREPMGNLNAINLYQHTGEGLGATYDVLIDAVRVATSWEALFNEKEVETAPEVITEAYEMVVSEIYLGFMEQGAEPAVTSVKVKGKNLKGDLTVSCKSEGYLTFNATTISKEAAESENGFELNITLDPKDGLVQKDIIRISGELANMELGVSWGFMAKANVNTVEELKAVKSSGLYTLVNQVTVKDIRTEKDNMGNNITYYTYEDGTGSVDAQYSKGGPGPRATSTLDNIQKGDYVRNLILQANNVAEDGGFKPAFIMMESPDLEIIKSGIENVSNGAVTGYTDGKFVAEGASNIKLFDVNGKRLKEVRGETLVMSEFSGAVYIVQYTDETGKVHTAKVMK